MFIVVDVRLLYLKLVIWTRIF